MQFVTSLFIFLVPTASLLILQYLPQLLSMLSSKSKGSPSPKRNVNLEPVSSFSSSIWCSECNRGAKCCQIENLYYFPKDKTFGFVLTENSIVHGISSGAEFGNLLANSVINHTELFLPLVVFANNDPIIKTVKSSLKGHEIFLLRRFKPDNLMHALHDDILPLFSRMETICKGEFSSCSKNFVLSFTDDYSDFNLDWYNLLFKQSIFNLTELREPVLISKAHVGLPGDTTVFQYGFGQPQGPLNLGPNSVGIYQRFAEYVKKQLDLNEQEKIDGVQRIVLISRKETRRILNEEEVMNFIRNSFHNTMGLTQELIYKIMDLSVERTPEAVVSTLTSADFILGMHGAATFLAGVFSRPNSTILELFPYGINPKVVSPLRALAETPGFWFKYNSWENKDVRSSVPPADDAPPLHGGLGSLSEEERKFAEKQVPVPAVQCCHNATYLYRMFQDTTVGPSIQYSILKSIEFLKRGTNLNWTHKFTVPGAVRDLVCLSEAESTKMFWKAPLNVKSVSQYNILKYEISAKSSNSDDDLFEATETNVFSDFENHQFTEVWVRACNQHECGKDTYVICT
ncbi:Hypothetical predicted protein [Cloeon dipterum]|uniref:Glycosyltransferase 61 catalytic domain-containing protein n=1 Tax=Cloeon dipterum TaxID=197152 RepID=A0A8S1CPD6_9INSE|nr:Hypothetical predicted protein [Cloeon dipterum]